MIHWPYSETDLIEAIDAAKPSWRDRAAKRTAKNLKAGKDSFETGIWSEIKRALLLLQGKKCGYCERPLWGGLVEVDVDHYRPKRAVSAWRSKLKPKWDLGASADKGYFGLVYEPRNYVIACKTCDTEWKKTAFPVAGSRTLDATDPGVLEAESPLLLNPVGDWNPDPATAVRFRGGIPQPHPDADDSMADRARVTIELMGLAVREELLIERARLVGTLWTNLRQRDTTSDDADRLDAENVLDGARHPQSPHTSCARAFIELYEVDEDAARALRDDLNRYSGTFA